MEIVLKDRRAIKLRFSYMLLRRLGKRWNLPGIQDIILKMLKAFEGVEEDTFTAIDIVAEIVVESAAIEGESLSIEDVSDYLFENMNVIALVIQEFFESLPKQDDKIDDVNQVKKKREG